MTTSPLLWTAPTGERLTFHAYPRHTDWYDKAGLYMFCRPGPGLLMPWVPLYVGKADSFKNRLCSHERWDEAARLGASHVLAMVENLEYNRTRFEDALIKHFDPKLNVLLRPENSLAAALGLYQQKSTTGLTSILGNAGRGMPRK